MRKVYSRTKSGVFLCPIFSLAAENHLLTFVKEILCVEPTPNQLYT